jgi:hypothetical protein
LRDERKTLRERKNAKEAAKRAVKHLTARTKNAAELDKQAFGALHACEEREKKAAEAAEKARLKEEAAKPKAAKAAAPGAVFPKLMLYRGPLAWGTQEQRSTKVLVLKALERDGHALQAASEELRQERRSSARRCCNTAQLCSTCTSRCGRTQS